MISNEAFWIAFPVLCLLALWLVVRRVVREAPRCPDCGVIVVTVGDLCRVCQDIRIERSKERALEAFREKFGRGA